jgi:hypothetical protein
MQGLIDVLDTLKGDTLLLVLHTLDVLVKLNEEIAERSVEAVIRRLQILWAHHYAVWSPFVCLLPPSLRFLCLLLDGLFYLDFVLPSPSLCLLPLR